ncbi:hypothetical protein L5515_006813 [Caenorhabditis briggsae]|uniref:SCP domain-containing protein n=1 Tax=Caenorhabditis briggsae TaxID=6238 RepID=A0AAE9F1F2_CAEBR|nr:hypothetical protein L5515_006813 [Caenorhabditis briggsae]
MTWDSSLATSAQAFAETCPTNHSNADGLGENIFFSYSATDKNSLDYYGARASQLWEEEFQQYGWDSTTMDDNASNIKDATQMAWAETGLIGCGVKVCGKDKSGASQFKYVVVCHYKKPGNKIGAEIYQPGDTCTACSAGLTYQAKGIFQKTNKAIQPVVSTIHAQMEAMQTELEVRQNLINALIKRNDELTATTGSIAVPNKRTKYDSVHVLKDTVIPPQSEAFVACGLPIQNAPRNLVLISQSNTLTDNDILVAPAVFSSTYARILVTNPTNDRGISSTSIFPRRPSRHFSLFLTPLRNPRTRIRNSRLT